MAREPIEELTIQVERGFEDLKDSLQYSFSGCDAGGCNYDSWNDGCDFSADELEPRFRNIEQQLDDIKDLHNEVLEPRLRNIEQGLEDIKLLLGEVITSVRSR